VKGLTGPLAAALLAASVPSPSPALDTFLAPPPAGFTEVTTSSIHGRFTADDYAATTDAAKRAQTLSALQRDGFVDGFGKTWVSRSEQHVMVVLAIAFSGGRGARNYLTASEVSDKSLATYSHADTMSGIDPYYGAHFVDTTQKEFGDGFAFAKGNDVFVVVIVSARDDALDETRAQTKAQFDLAPSETIPSGQWPEKANPPSLGWLVPIVLGAGFAVAAVLVIVAIVMSRRQPAPQQTLQQTVHMSPDGNYWWDGYAWRDAGQMAPPHAQRSGDGALWWDGRGWRPVPHAPAPL
jgi:hypothetical protein